MKHRITWAVKKTGEKTRIYAIFRSYVTSDEESENNENNHNAVDLKVTVVNPSEIIAIARKLGSKVSGAKKWMTIDDDDTYFRLIVYAVVRRSIKKPIKIDKLKELVLDEHFDLDAWWWANTFMNKYKTLGVEQGLGVRSLFRPAKAFKLIYGLAEK